MNNHLKIIVLSTLALAVGLTACSSPALVGMKVHIQNGDYESAIHVADSAIANGEAQNPEIWLWRGRAFSIIRNWKQAARSYNEAYQLDNSYRPQLAEEWFVFYNAAGTYLAEDSLEGTMAMLETGKSIVPERPEFDQMLGDIELGRGNNEAALESFQASWAKAEPLIESYQQKLEQATDEREIEYYTENLDIALSNAVLSLYNIGMINQQMALDAEDEAASEEYLAASEAALLEAVELDPGNADVLKGLADIYLLEGRFEEAMQTFEEAFEGIETGVEEGWITPEQAEDMRTNIMLTRGIALLEMQMYDEAISELNAVMERAGDEYRVLASIAHAYFQLESYDDALGMLDKALELEGLTPSQAAEAYYMKFACLSRKEMDEEAAALEAALRFDPENATYWEYLASTYSRLGRRAEAIEAMNKAEELGGGS